MHALSRQPTPLVEAGLGPSRLDRARAQLDHGTLGRRTLSRKLQQDGLVHRFAREPSHLGLDPQRESRPTSRAGDDRHGVSRLADPCPQNTRVEHPEP